MPGRASSGGTRFFENLAYLVPGYRGYKERGLRREEDARLRGRVLARLQGVSMLLDERVTRLSEQALDSASEAVGRRLRRAENLARAVRYAPYGFSGFFDVDTVREEALERLLETDLLLFQDIDDLTEMIRAAPFPPRSRSALGRFLEAVDDALEQVENRLIARDKVLGSP